MQLKTMLLVPHSLSCRSEVSAARFDSPLLRLSQVQSKVLARLLLSGVENLLPS